jgi:hypothetical protein
MKQRVACPILIDLRNMYSGEDVDRHGFLRVDEQRPSRQHVFRKLRRRASAVAGTARGMYERHCATGDALDRRYDSAH